MKTYTTEDPVASFLYELMRDHVTPGIVERLVQLEEVRAPGDVWVLTNGHLGRYAADLAKRLKGAAG